MVLCKTSQENISYVKNIILLVTIFYIQNYEITVVFIVIRNSVPIHFIVKVYSNGDNVIQNIRLIYTSIEKAKRKSFVRSKRKLKSTEIMGKWVVQIRDESDELNAVCSLLVLDWRSIRWVFSLGFMNCLDRVWFLFSLMDL